MVLEADFYLSAWVSRELITSRGYRRWGGASRNKNPLKQLKNTFVAGDLLEKEPANDGRFEKWFLQVKPPREHFFGKNLPILGHAYEGNIFRTMFQRLKNLRCQNPQKTFDACENAGSPDFCSFVTLRTAGEVGFDFF